MNRGQFQLWRLFAAVGCCAVATAVVKVAIFEIEEWGGGPFPTLCILGGVLLAIAGVGLLSQRAGAFMLRSAWRTIRFISHFWD